MINMSYCRFENTALAVEECIDALNEDGLDSLSDSEKDYANRLHELAEEFIELYNKQK